MPSQMMRLDKYMTGCIWVHGSDVRHTCSQFRHAMVRDNPLLSRRRADAGWYAWGAYAHLGPATQQQLSPRGQASSATELTAALG